MADGLPVGCRHMQRSSWGHAAQQLGASVRISPCPKPGLLALAQLDLRSPPANPCARPQMLFPPGKELAGAKESQVTAVCLRWGRRLGRFFPAQREACRAWAAPCHSAWCCVACCVATKALLPLARATAAGAATLGLWAARRGGWTDTTCSRACTAAPTAETPRQALRLTAALPPTVAGRYSMVLARLRAHCMTDIGTICAALPQACLGANASRTHGPPFHPPPLQVMAEAIKKSAPGVPAPKELLDSPGVTAHSGPVNGVCAGEARPHASSGMRWTGRAPQATPSAVSGGAAPTHGPTCDACHAASPTRPLVLPCACRRRRQPAGGQRRRGRLHPCVGLSQAHTES